MKQKQPLITVLIPVYNVEKFVKSAISSITNQSYKNLQIIVIDDCSTDNTYNTVLGLSKLDSRILLLRNHKKSRYFPTFFISHV